MWITISNNFTFLSPRLLFMNVFVSKSRADDKSFIVFVYLFYSSFLDDVSYCFAEPGFKTLVENLKILLYFFFFNNLLVKPFEWYRIEIEKVCLQKVLYMSSLLYKVIKYPSCKILFWLWKYPVHKTFFTIFYIYKSH